MRRARLSRPLPVPIGECVVCGCTESRACPGGCAWLAYDADTERGVCSACVRTQPEARRRLATALHALEEA